MNEKKDGLNFDGGKNGFDKFREAAKEAEAFATEGMMSMAKDSLPVIMDLMWGCYKGFRDRGASVPEALKLTELVFTVGGKK